MPGGSGPGKSAYVPTVRDIANEATALELRRAGATFEQIAEQIGVHDRGAAHKVYKRALARVHLEPATEIRRLEADRLDALQLAVWQRAVGGDLKAVDRVLRIMHRRANLLGLDHEHGVAEAALQLEAERVRMIALAFGRALDAMNLTPEQREVGTRVLFEELRAAEQAAAAAAEQDDGGGEVVDEAG